MSQRIVLPPVKYISSRQKCLGSLGIAAYIAIVLAFAHHVFGGK